MFDLTADDTRVPTKSDLDRLCGVYDGLLTEGRGVSPDAAAELTAMAGIYDLDADRPHEAVWRDLRAVLVRQIGVDPDARPVNVGELTLMVVEDDPHTAQDLIDTLIEAGHRVVGPFHDGDAAEAAAALYDLDGALLDINLSGETTGVELAERLKTRWGVPVIFLSGDVTTAARHADLAEALVVKPYGRVDVTEALSRLVMSRLEPTGLSGR